MLKRQEEAYKVKKKHHPTLVKDKGFPTTMTEAYDTARFWEHQYHRSIEWNQKQPELKSVSESDHFQ